MTNELYQRELGWMELLSMTFSEFIRNIKGILYVMVAVFFPLSLLESVISTRMNAINSFLATMQAAGTILEEKEAMQILFQMLTGSLLAAAVALFLAPVGTAAIAKMVKQSVDGEEYDVKTALKDAFPLMPTFIVVGVINFVLVSLGCLVIIPGIWLTVLWVFYVYCISLGGRKGWDSLRHSGELVHGHWWRTFGYTIVLACVSSLWSLLVILPFSFIELMGGENFVLTVLQNFLTYFSNSFVCIGMALLFINRESQHLGWQPFGQKKAEEPKIIE